MLFFVEHLNRIDVASWKSSIRKSKDYVYGIWLYKVLGIWKGFIE